MGGNESSNPLNDLNNSPMIPTELNGGTPCYRIDINNNIIFNYTYFKNDYNTLNDSIEKFKNLLKIEDTNDLNIAIVRIAELIKNIKEQKILEDCNFIIANYKSDFEEYFNCLKEMFKLLKDIFESNQNYVKQWLKYQKINNHEIEINRENNEKNKIKKLQNSFHKFNDELQSIQEILNSFNLTNEQLNNITELKKYYEDNNENINLMFTFKNHSEFISFINAILQLKIYFNERNNLINQFISVYNNFCNLYCIILQEIPKSENKVDIMNELNQYLGMIIKHRLIRHIQIKIQEMENFKFIDLKNFIKENN